LKPSEEIKNNKVDARAPSSLAQLQSQARSNVVLVI